MISGKKHDSKLALVFRTRLAFSEKGLDGAVGSKCRHRESGEDLMRSPCPRADAGEAHTSKNELTPIIPNYCHLLPKR